MTHIISSEHGDISGWGSDLGPHGYPKWDQVDILAPPFTGFSDVKSWPHLSPAAALGRAVCVSGPGSKVELVLVAGVWVSQPRGMSVGELTLPFTGCSMWGSGH